MSKTRNHRKSNSSYYSEIENSRSFKTLQLVNPGLTVSKFLKNASKRSGFHGKLRAEEQKERDLYDLVPVKPLDLRKLKPPTSLTTAKPPSPLFLAKTRKRRRIPTPAVPSMKKLRVPKNGLFSLPVRL